MRSIDLQVDRQAPQRADEDSVSRGTRAIVRGDWAEVGAGRQKEIAKRGAVFDVFSDKRSGWTRGCFVLSKRRNSHPRNWTFNVRLKAFWLAYTPLPKEEERVESAPFARGRGSRASRNEKSPAKSRRTLPKIYTRCVWKIPGPSKKTGIDFPADPPNHISSRIKLASDSADLPKGRKRWKC